MKITSRAKVVAKMVAHKNSKFTIENNKKYQLVNSTKFKSK